MNARASVRLAISTVALIGLVSCQTLGTREPTVEPVIAKETDFGAESRLPPQEQVNLAIQALQVGDNETARRRLNWALQQKPNLRTARRLLRQLDTDPVEYLGSKYFDYRIQPGDSLSELAARYLDDSLKFVILSRYNGISDPSQLKVGQLLRIPGAPPPPDNSEEDAESGSELVVAEESLLVETAGATAQTPEMITTPEAGAHEEPDPDPIPYSPPAVAEPGAPQAGESLAGTNMETGDDIYLSAQKMYRIGRYPEAIALLEGAMESSGADSNLHTLLVRDLLVRAYESYGEQLADAGKIRAAKSVLEKAVALDPDNEKAAGQLIRVQERLGNSP